jgi:6-pyruvoyltetrahydropterin/6-carboxytetrahydropterin synthase
MPVIKVTRKASFNAAHRLNVPAWTDEKNKSFFGLCNLPNYHGHNYTLFVELTCEVDPVSGYGFDLNILNGLIQKHIIEPFDHKNLNLDTQEFANINPTAENIAIVCWQKLTKAIDDDNTKIAIILYETERNFVRYEGN